MTVEESRRQQKAERGWQLGPKGPDQSHDAGKSRAEPAPKQMSIHTQSSFAILEGALDSLGYQRVGHSEMFASCSRGKSTEDLIEEEFASYQLPGLVQGIDHAGAASHGAQQVVENQHL